MLNELTRNKIDKFFHSECGEEVMDYAGKKLGTVLSNIEDEFTFKLRDYLRDEYSVFFEDLVRDGIIKEVNGLLSGKHENLERFGLSPADWGLRCDPEGIRKKVAHDNENIIKDTYVQSLEEENARLRERIDRLNNHSEY